MRTKFDYSFIILLVLSGIGVICIGYILPFCPAGFSLGTAYAAYAVQQGHTSYPEFVYHTFTNSEPSKPETVTVSAGTHQRKEPDTIKAPSTVPLDISAVDLKNETGLTLSLSEEMENYSPPNKNAENPQILILHTHATESFAGTDNRTTDCTQNMVAVGEFLAQKLNEYGFYVLHDKTLHDYPNYNGSYVASSKTAEWYLKEYPSLEIVLDLHRDGISLTDGTKIPVHATHQGSRIAQMMLVVGSDTNLEHPAWKENLKFATGLHATVEALCPGAMRPLNIRKERFNQQLSPNAVIVEMGSNGNTLEEVLGSARLLAEALFTYIK